MFLRLSSFLLTLFSAIGTVVPISSFSNPNILVIVSDDQGWGDIGYNDPEIRSPNLDKLAENGVRLDCHYVQPQCTPTRVALMTGRYPSRFGPHCTKASNDQAYPLGTLTMASMLKDLGYETALIGKWHMGSKPVWGPNRYGFDSSYGSLAGAVGMYDHRYRLDTPYTQTWHRNLEFIEEEGHSTDLIAREAVQWLERKRDKPFFLYLPFNAVHTPLVEEEKWLKQNEHIEHEDRRLYAAAVTHMDWAVGEVVEALERIGQRENTLIVFTSDNGAIVTGYPGDNYPPPDPALDDFSSNGPFRGKKGQVYEGGMRVPAFVHWPGHLDHRTVDAPIHAVDWVPTLANRLGYTPKEDPKWDGENVWPLLSGEADSASDRVLYWVWGGESDRERVALRQGGWKILREGREGVWELYNLAVDPSEKNDLASSDPERMKVLKSLFEKEASKDKSS